MKVYFHMVIQKDLTVGNLSILNETMGVCTKRASDLLLGNHHKTFWGVLFFYVYEVTENIQRMQRKPSFCSQIFLGLEISIKRTEIPTLWRSKYQ